MQLLLPQRHCIRGLQTELHGVNVSELYDLILTFNRSGLAQSRRHTALCSELVHAHTGNLHSAYTQHHSSNLLVTLQLLIPVNCRIEFTRFFKKGLYTNDLLMGIYQ